MMEKTDMMCSGLPVAPTGPTIDRRPVTDRHTARTSESRRAAVTAWFGVDTAPGAGQLLGRLRHLQP